MMKKYLIGFLTLVMAASIAFAVGVCASADADEPVASPTVVAANLAYDGEVRLVFAADLDGLASANTRLLVWTEAREEYTEGTESYSVECAGFADVFGQRRPVFVTEGIPLSALDGYIYVRLAGDWMCRSHGHHFVGDVLRYSPILYAHNRLTDDGVTAKQAASYERLLEIEKEEYGKREGSSLDSKYIELFGATTYDGHSSAISRPGKVVTVVTEREDFRAFVDQNGNILSREKRFSYLVTKNRYTAIYAAGDEKINVKLVGAKLADGSVEGEFYYDETVTATADIFEGGIFVGWAGNDGSIISTEKTVTVPAITLIKTGVLKAVITGGEGAHFDDLALDKKVDKTKIKTGGVELYNNQPDNATATVATDSRDGYNRVLSVNKTVTGKGNSIVFNATGSGKGCYLLEFDICYLNGNDTVLMQINMGDAYRLQIRQSSGYIIFHDATTDGSIVNYIGAFVEVGDWIHVRVEHYQGDGSIEQRFTKIYFDGKLTAISKNSRTDAATPKYDSVSFYSLYDSKYSYMLDNVIVRRESAAFVDDGDESTIYCGRDKSSTNDDYKWLMAEITMGSEVTEALRDIMTIFDDRVYEWYANLFDPETCGFYYSNDARDYVGFLPDLESTEQAMSFLAGTGIGSMEKIYTDEMKARIVNWVQSMQSNTDGYFYHPQWGTSISVSRRGRDNGWAIRLLERFEAEPLYPTAADRLSGGTATAAMPLTNLTSPLGRSAAAAVSSVIPAAVSTVGNAHLKSEAAFIEYLDYLFANTTTTAENGTKVPNTYSIGNTVGSQSGVISAAGLTDVCIDYFNKKQNPSTGLWEADVNYRTVSGLMKIGGMYNSLKRELPNADKAIRSALDVATSNEPLTQVVYVYNPLVAINNSLSNLNNYSTSKDAQAIRAAVYAETRERALELIANTKAKLSVFKKADGSLSYGATAAPANSQGAPVCFGANEGDVNGCGLCNGTIGSLFSVFGLSRPNYYDAEDSARFVEIIMNKEPVVKKSVAAETVDFEKENEDLVTKYITFNTKSSGSSATVDAVNGNSYAHILSKKGGNDGLSYKYSESVVDPAMFVLDFDLCLTPDAANTSSALIQIRLTGAYMITVDIKEGKCHVYDSSSTGTGNKTNDLGIYFGFGQWVNLRIEYYVGTKDTVKIKTYLDGKLAATSNNYYGSKTGSSSAAWPDPATDFSSVQFSTLNAAVVDVKIDNIFADKLSASEIK